MDTFLQFALLGLGAGGAYAIAGLGLTQVYRGSGVLNLAHGAQAFFSAVLFVWAYQHWSFPFAAAAALAIASAAAMGGLVELLVMRRLRDAAILVRIIATLGVFAILEQAVPLIFGVNFQYQDVANFYPSGAVKVVQSVSLPYNRIILVAVTAVLAAGLRLVMNRTRFGLATTATAESPLVTASYGIDPGRTAVLNWVIGSALAGTAGVLLVPIVGSLNPTPLLLFVIPTLAASMIGRFSSYGLTVAGGLIIGIGQSLLTRYQGSIFPSGLASGWPDALPFLVIIGVLVAGGTPFPKRGELASRLPKIGRTKVHPILGVAITLVGGAGVLLSSDYLAGTVATVAALAIVGLSLVVITGLAGQTSLAQLSLAGAGGLVAARVSHSVAWPFPVVTLIGVVAGSLLGLVFAIPALRTRGPTLAIATLGIGIAVDDVVLNNGKITLASTLSGTPVQHPTLLGWSIDDFTHPQRYAAVVLVLFGLLAVAVANLRSSPTGRRLMALRNSERASAALGISIFRTKTAAFVLAAALASLGGVMMAFQNDVVTYSQFSLINSLNLVIFTIIGGIGYVTGPLIGAVLSPSGFVTYFFNSHQTVHQWLITLGGVGLIAMLISYPHGQARIGEILSARTTKAERNQHRVGNETERRDPARLVVKDLTVAYGPVKAVRSLNLVVEPGQIVGLIGPNGAGKTTALDAVSGFIRGTTGTISLGDVDLTPRSAHRRAAAGIGRTFQTVEPFDDLSIGENLAVSLEQVRWWDWLVDLFKPRPLALPASIRDAADGLGLHDLGAEPDSVSQGHRRLLGVMRALAGNPSVVLLDEPAAGLSASETTELGQVLRRLATERQVGMLLVEHDLSLVTSICDRVIAIDFGETIFDGPTGAATSSTSIKSAYLGEIVDDDPAVTADDLVRDG